MPRCPMVKSTQARRTKRSFCQSLLRAPVHMLPRAP